MSATKRRMIVVLPAYNEERDLPVLLDRIGQAMEESQAHYQILVMDDGSTDRTYKVATDWSKQGPLQVRRHPGNTGLGATLRDGIQWACEVASANDIIFTLDADNSHTPELITRMSRMVREGHDVVIASRYQRGSRVRGVPFSRRFLSRAASLLFRALFPIKGVRDYTCGYRAYRAGLLQEVMAEDPGFVDQDGFQAMVDVLLKLRRNPNIIFGEVPLILRYDLKEGESKMNVAETSRNTLKLMLRRRFE